MTHRYGNKLNEAKRAVATVERISPRHVPGGIPRTTRRNTRRGSAYKSTQGK
jgi:hypothetical protein